jgi:hypothetical protein
MLNSASLTRAGVGRVDKPGKVFKARFPAILIAMIFAMIGRVENSFHILKKHRQKKAWARFVSG